MMSGVVRLRVVVAEPEPVHDAGAIVLDHHVRLFDQSHRHGEAGGFLQVEAQAALIAIGDDEIRADAVQRPPGAAPRSD